MRTVRIVGAVLALVSVACGGGGANPGAGGGQGSSGSTDGRITVFAAASLTEAFRDLAEAFGEAEDGGTVVLNLAGSQALAAQILSGAPTDAFASANAIQMERVRKAELLADSAVVFAENGLAVVTAPGNPLGIDGLSDLSRPDLAVVLAAPQVPVGRYARRALDAAGVAAEPVSLETDTKQVLAKVALGEADAGIVYRTDVRAAGDAVSGVAVAPEHDPGARYRIGVVRDGPSLAGARRFVDFLRSTEGRTILRAHGFELPSPSGPGPGAPETE